MKKMIFFIILLSSVWMVSCDRHTVVITPDMNEKDVSETISKTLASGKKDIEVIFKNGDYYLTHPITLINEKGMLPERIWFRAEQPHGAIIRFDKPLAGKLKEVTAPSVLRRLPSSLHGHVFEVDLKELGVDAERFPDLFKDRTNFPQLIYNGDLLPLSRYPDEGYMYMKKVLDNFGTPEQGGTFEYSDERHNRWTEAVGRGLWFTGYWRVPWQAWTVRVQDIDTIRMTVTHAVGIETLHGEDVGVFGGIGSKYHRPYGSGEEPYYVENLLEETDSPGEWCIDFTDQKLYLYPPSGFDELALSLVWNNDPMFYLENVNGFSIENMILKNHLGDGVVCSGGKGNLFAGCVFRNILGNALTISGGEGHTALSNDFCYIGRTCIEISGGSRAELSPANHLVANNYFTRFGEVQKSYATAVKVGAYTTGIGKDEGNAVGITVRNNLVHNAPHAAFIYGGNDNILEYNEVFDIARITGDVGAFYARWDWTSRGNVLRHNFVHHIPRANAFYGDDGHAGDSVYRNVVYQALTGTLIGGGHANYVHNNLYMECIAAAIHIDSRGKQRNYNASNPDFSDLFYEYKITDGAWDHRYSGISGFIFRNSLDYPQDNDIEGNFFINCPVGIRKEGKEGDFRYSFFGKNEELKLQNFDFLQIIRDKDLSTIPDITDPDLFELKKSGLYIDEYRTVLPDRGELLKKIPPVQQAGFDSVQDQQATDNAG